MKVLELYSGIGGMHYALKESGVPGEIVASIDINPVANVVYNHNFPLTKLLNKNIKGLKVDFLNQFDINTILMSPPCQPFTRNGNQKDVLDERTYSFIHLLKLLPLLNIKYILLENVKGFETSEMRNLFIKVLKKANYDYREFILSPHQFGVPNTRHRYYCLAKKNSRFTFGAQDNIIETTDIFDEKYQMFSISDIIEDNIDIKNYLLSDVLLRKRARILDVCFKDSTRSCCFTKAYSRYVEGTGSVFTDKTKDEFDSVYEQLKDYRRTDDEYLNLLKTLNLRFFTPKEVSRLMSFPDTFKTPSHITNKQCYNLLGNSLNIKVVSELIKLLNK